MIILHILNLDTVGGVEQLFHQFIASPSAFEEQDDHALITGGPIHSYFKEQLVPRLKSIEYTKTWRGLKIPRSPRNLRRMHEDRLVRKVRPDLGVLWNRFGDNTSMESLRKCGAHVVHYEHGAAWLAPVVPGNRDFLSGIDSAICASHAAKRVLQLRWGYSGKTEVVLNCLRPELVSAAATPKEIPTDRPVRLGIAAR